MIQDNPLNIKGTHRLRKRLLPFAYKFTGSKFTGDFIPEKELEEVAWAILEPGKTDWFIAHPMIPFKAQKLCTRAQDIGLVLEDFRVGMNHQTIGAGSLPICQHDELDLGEVEVCHPSRQISAKVRNSGLYAIKFKLWFSGIIAEEL
jgi:hypothetical protein